MAKGIDLLPVIIPGETVRENPIYGEAAGPPETKSPYVVIVYNDDWHSFDEVQRQLQKATACTLEKAEALSVEIHFSGRAVVYSGSPVECERVANVLREIRLQVETDRA